MQTWLREQGRAGLYEWAMEQRARVRPPSYEEVAVMVWPKKTPKAPRARTHRAKLSKRQKVRHYAGGWGRSCRQHGRWAYRAMVAGHSASAARLYYGRW